jgi:hypothetical protein
MKPLSLALLMLSFCLMSATANAYDEDTHFYATYSLARFAGIEHEVATKLALSAQWMDECFLSDPTSLILLPFDGIKKRRLLHFPSIRNGNDIAVANQDEGFGFEELKGLRKKISDHLIKKYNFDVSGVTLHTTTVPNDPFASGLIREGLREGDLMKAGASLHVIEDSYAHAGTSAEIGHTSFWHWPDRPFENQDSIQKYFQMTGTVLKAMVAIRAQLPDSAKDCTLKVGAKTNCTMTAGELNAAYSAIPSVQRTVSIDVLKSVEYIRPVLQKFIEKAVSVKYLKAGKDYNAMIDEVLTENSFNIGNADPKNSLDAYMVLERFIRKLVMKQGGTHVGEYLDVEQLPRDMNLITDPHIRTLQYIENNGGINAFLHEVTRSLLIGYVPINLGTFHREEAENDHAMTRPLEMDIRNANMQKLIFELYGVKLQFVHNNTSDDKGFGKEVTMNPVAEPKIENPQPGVVYATFSLAEKNRFDHMVFNYLFPSMGDDALKAIVRFVILMKHGPEGLKGAGVKEAPQTRTEWFWGLPGRLIGWATYYLGTADEAAQFLGNIKQYEQALLKDLFTSRLVPVGDERFYQNMYGFETYKVERRGIENNPGLYPEFFGPHDAWSKNITSAALNNQPSQLR